MTKEYMLSIDELEAKYTVGSIVNIDGKRYKVVEIIDALPTTCFASFPSVVFNDEISRNLPTRSGMDFFTRFSDDIDHTASSYGTKSDQYKLHKIFLNAKDQLKKTGKLRLEKQCAREYLVIEISVYMGADALLVRKEHWDVDRTNLRKKKLTEIKRNIDNFVDDDLYDLITDGKYKIL